MTAKCESITTLKVRFQKFLIQEWMSCLNRSLSLRLLTLSVPKIQEQVTRKNVPDMNFSLILEPVEYRVANAELWCSVTGNLLRRGDQFALSTLHSIS